MSGAGFAELDGEPVDAADALSLALTGYGHFTTLLAQDGATRGLDLHLERLRSDGVHLFGRPPATAARITGLVGRAAAHARRTVVRVTVFAPATGVAAPEADHPLNVLVTTRPAPEDPDGADGGGLRLSGVCHQRDLPEVKHTGLLPALHHRRAARLGGFDDALFLGPTGDVLEGPTWTVGFCDPDGQVVWPTGPRLAGVTEALLRRAGVSSRHAAMPWPDLRRSPAGWTAFVTSAVTGLRPVASIDGVPLDARPDRVDHLRRLYRALPPRSI